MYFKCYNFAYCAKNEEKGCYLCIASNKPVDIISIMLGTNDCNLDLHLSVDDISKGMEKLIITIIQECPNIQGFVPRIIIMAPSPILEDSANSPFAYQLDENSVNKITMKVRFIYFCDFKKR